MQSETKYITIGGQKTVCNITNKKQSGPTWLFIHGWATKKEIWNDILKQLPEKGVAVDLPGFGESEVLRSPWHVSDYVAAVSDLVEKLELTDVILVGHSLGGQIAAPLAADKPVWLRGLVLVNASVIRQQRSGWLSSVGRLISPLFHVPGMRWLRSELYDVIGADQPPKDENLKKTMRHVQREDQRSELSQITVPTAVVWGCDDGDTPLSDGRAIAQEIKTATLSVLTGGHHVFVDESDSFISILKQFVKKIT